MSDALGRMTQVFEAPNAPDYNYLTTYSYDALGKLTRVTQGEQTRDFTYSSLSRLVSATNPESGTTTFEYDETGNLKKRTDPRLLPDAPTHVETTYDYDALNRVTSRTYNDGTPDVTYTYDAAGVANSKGRLTQVSSSVSTYNYTGYDALGHVTGSEQVMPNGGGTPTTYAMPDYRYDLAGHLLSEQYPSGRVVKTDYDVAGRAARVKNQASGLYYVGGAADSNERILYNADGAATAIKLGNGLWERIDFNSRLQLTQLRLGTVADASSVLGLSYTHGVITGGTLNTTKNNGNIQSQTIALPGATPLAQSYLYDEVNRLKSAEEKAGTNSTWKQSYFYDQYGNRTLTAESTYPSQLTTSNNPAVSTSNNRINSAGYVYDEVGNLKCDALHQCATGGPLSAPSLSVNISYFDYDAENRLVRAGSGGTGAEAGGANYSYDAAGKRVKTVVGNTTTVFVYDAMGMLVAEYGGAQSPAGGTNYLTTDTLGSTRVVTGQSKEVKARYDYLPFGEGLTSAFGGRSTVPGYDPAAVVRKRFGTYERDAELLDMDFAQARHYNFRHGRFTSADPLMASADVVNPQSLNRYSYVGNNPVNVADPTGEIWGELNGAIQWFDTAEQMAGEGFHAYTALVAQIKGTTQLVALNPYANQIEAVADATQAIQQLVEWGVGAEIVAEAASALSLPALAVGVAVAGYFAAEDSLDGRPEPVKGFKMAKWQERYIDRVLSKMNEKAAENAAAASDAASASSENQNRGREQYFVRFGSGEESAAALTQDANRTLREPGHPYGVSVMLRDRISGSDRQHKSATVAEVQAAFRVEQTGKNPRHYTVILPNP
jgi:RHS repeat-associated protein